MCEYVCTSCLKVLWQETLRRSLLESGRSSEICWLSKIWGVTASEAAISVKRKPNKILCTGSSLLLREPFLRFYSPVLLSHCEDKTGHPVWEGPREGARELCFEYGEWVCILYF